ncbi:DUF2314 domain-containing protein [Flavobacterium sp. LS1R47]|jgi:uncharacterized protein YegJ (DUF2314 family)|uniref:DUF2314 domain-containing protein n=1 Tax=Flavobacterium frigoritolerans TaxID=2987686 RepID=A0A9X2ZRX4_9FLAO|nr:DUF2314 domain-containing protein [Flavobacterium frigoritolerans]MCV9933752.1 DUF2314 domain-containing protein [Flavobacterium frigoritolerans]
MANQEIFFAKGDSPKMIEAFKNAQETFKYFWRELSWESRRIVPALTVACVKVAFSQNINGSENPTIEHMWINDIDFDGEQVRGVLINDPDELTNIQNGDDVAVPLNQISDWLFAIQGSSPKGLSKLFSSSQPRAYGGFTIQAIRSEMTNQERKDHDKAWGLDFGDFNEVLLVNEQKEKPENLVEHPMSKNMKEKLQEFLEQNPDEITFQDEDGFSLLHRETIAGNVTSVAVLLESGANKDMKTNQGKTALDIAKQLKWEHLISTLSN